MKLLVIGGAASGKSEYAEDRAVDLGGKLTYIATMEPFGAEAEARIARHRLLRKGKGFDTLECTRGLADIPLPGGTCLLECMTNLVANEMFAPDGAGGRAVPAILAGVRRLARHCDHLVVVTGNVFGEGTDYSPETVDYMSKLAELNRRLAMEFDQVTEVVCGIPLVRKG